MPITHLSVTDVRNLTSVTFAPSPSINLLYGENGAGKTSVLEAIHLLALARSFRSTKIKPVIKASSEHCTVFARLHDGRSQIPIGIERNLDGSVNIRASGNTLGSVSELVALLPLQLINPDSFRLLEGSPKDRRRFLDWGVFHVEQQFYPVWKRVQRCLKQRNRLLRHGRIERSQLRIWDLELANAATALDQMRAAYMERFWPNFQQVLARLIDLPDLTINYYRGWDKATPLEQVLEQSFNQDLACNYTRLGPQRADLRVKMGSHNAVEILSRGQQKLVVCAMKIAQGFVHAELSQRPCVYLVDDLPSELDQKHRQALCSLLAEMGCQVFITSVDKVVLESCWSSETDMKMFHVEQGEVTEICRPPASRRSDSND